MIDPIFLPYHFMQDYSNSKLLLLTINIIFNFSPYSRVGDSPIPGSGAFVDAAVGGAAATGDGDVMLRLLPAHLAVEAMRPR